MKCCMKALETSTRPARCWRQNPKMRRIAAPLPWMIGVSGPSGVGKTEVLAELYAYCPKIEFIPMITDRMVRQSDGAVSSCHVLYPNRRVFPNLGDPVMITSFFPNVMHVTAQTYQALVKGEALIELPPSRYGKHYSLPVYQIARAIAAGRSALAEADPEIMGKLFDSTIFDPAEMNFACSFVTIFLTPCRFDPSNSRSVDRAVNLLRQRLHGREGNDALFRKREDGIRQKLAEAGNYDFVVENPQTKQPFAGEQRAVQAILKILSHLKIQYY